MSVSFALAVVPSAPVVGDGLSALLSPYWLLLVHLHVDSEAMLQAMVAVGQCIARHAVLLVLYVGHEAKFGGDYHRHCSGHGFAVGSTDDT